MNMDPVNKLYPFDLIYILSAYSPFSDRFGLPLHNIHNPSPFTSIMDIFFVDLKFGHIHFYTLYPCLSWSSNRSVGPLILISAEYIVYIMCVCVISVIIDEFC